MSKGLSDLPTLTQLVSGPEWGPGGDPGPPAGEPKALAAPPPPSSICLLSQEGTRTKADSPPGGRLWLGRTEQNALLLAGP